MVEEKRTDVKDSSIHDKPRGGAEALDTSLAQAWKTRRPDTSRIGVARPTLILHPQKQ